LKGMLLRLGRSVSALSRSPSLRRPLAPGDLLWRRAEWGCARRSVSAECGPDELHPSGRSEHCDRRRMVWELRRNSLRRFAEIHHRHLSRPRRQGDAWHARYPSETGRLRRPDGNRKQRIRIQLHPPSCSFQDFDGWNLGDDAARLRRPRRSRPSPDRQGSRRLSSKHRTRREAASPVGLFYWRLSGHTSRTTYLLRSHCSPTFMYSCFTAAQAMRKAASS
jgi:hypothetical protein